MIRIDVIQNKGNRTHLMFIDDNNLAIAEIVFYRIDDSCDVHSLTLYKNNFMQLKSIIDRIIKICENNNIKKITITIKKDDKNCKFITKVLDSIKFEKLSETESFIGFRLRLSKSKQ